MNCREQAKGKTQTDGYFYFLTKDLNALVKKIGELKAKKNELLKEKGDSINSEAAKREDSTVSGQYGEEINKINIQINNLQKIRNRARIIDPQPNKGFVAVGRKVSIKDAISDEIMHLQIGSYRTYAASSQSGDNPVYTEISYSAPIAEIIMCKTVGEKLTGNIGGIEKTFEILKIE